MLFSYNILVFSLSSDLGHGPGLTYTWWCTKELEELSFPRCLQCETAAGNDMLGEYKTEAILIDTLGSDLSST